MGVSEEIGEGEGAERVRYHSDDVCWGARIARLRLKLKLRLQKSG